MANPQASTAADKRRLLQVLILFGAVATLVIISLISLIDPQIKAFIIAAEGVIAVLMYFVVGKLVK